MLQLVSVFVVYFTNKFLCIGPYQKSKNIALKDRCEDFSNWNSTVAENVGSAAITEPALILHEQPQFCCFESFSSPLTPPAVEQLQGSAFMVAPSAHDLLTVQQFDRQTSLSIAMEVLGQAHPNCNLTMDLYPPTPSSTDSQDDQYIQHPSPFSNVTDGLQRVRTVSEPQECLHSSPMDDPNCRQRALSSDQVYIQENGQTITCYNMARQASDETASQGGNANNPGKVFRFQVNSLKRMISFPITNALSN